MKIIAMNMFVFCVIPAPHLCLKSVHWMDEWINQTMCREINDASENHKNGYKVYLWVSSSWYANSPHCLIILMCF